MELSRYSLFVFISISVIIWLSIVYRIPLVVKHHPPIMKALLDRKVPKRPEGPCNNSINFNGSSPFPDIFLAINFNHPFYQNIPLLKRYFERLFPNYFFCGPEVDFKGGHPIIVIPQPRGEYGYYGFQCLAEAIRRNPGYAGYFYVNDDMIINWWNFYKLDKTKIWFPGPTKMGQHDMLPNKVATPWWWTRAACLERCSKLFTAMESDPKITETNAIKMYLENVGNKRVCSNGLSDILYIPAKFAKTYEMVTQKFYDNLVFLEVSTPMAISMLDKRENMIDIAGLYLQIIYGWGPWTSKTDRAWLKYNYKTYFLHPYKFSGENQAKNSREFEDRVLLPSEKILKDKCLDIIDRGRFWK